MTSKDPPTVPFWTAGSLGISFQNVALLSTWPFSFKLSKPALRSVGQSHVFLALPEAPGNSPPLCI